MMAMLDAAVPQKPNGQRLMQTTIDNSADKTDGNKEPWLAVGLSWLLPGVGHLYCVRWRTGVALILLALLLLGMGVVALMVPRIPMVALAGVFLCLLALQMGSSVAAFRAAWKSNTGDFERQRTWQKDPWLAVFLSVIWPGLGHLYLRRWITGGVLILAYFVLPPAGRNTYTFVATAGLRMLVPFFAYFASPAPRRKSRQPLVVFGSVFIGVVSLTVLVALVLRSCVVHITIVEGRSMAPTLHNGMRMVVDKLVYRWQEPTVGDIISFVPPDHLSVTDRRPNMKRVVATGGQTVQVRDGFVWIDGQRREPPGTPQDYIATYFQPAPNRQADYFACGVTEPYRVPEDCYFVLGDNRANSLDSRCYGAVPRESIAGKVVRVLWPLNAPPLYGDESR